MLGRVARLFASVDELAGQWNEAVAATDGADLFCSSSVWSFAAASSFPLAEPPTVLAEGGAFYGVRRVAAEAGLLLGLDPIWGFATPVVGPSAAGAQLVAGRLRTRDWDVAALTGQARGMPMTEALISALGDRFVLGVGPEESRLRADLTGGVEAWTVRRSSRFRQRLRQIEERATSAGVDVEDASGHTVDDLLARVIGIERRSWKGEEGTGLADPHLVTFYRHMLRRLQPTGGVRALVARLDGEDVGYVLGGVCGATYRGFQLSHARSAGSLGVGHLLQLHEVRRAAAEGLATYDLGMAMPYKQRWADRVDTTFTLVVRR